eukprot:g7728.t1
MEKTGGMRRDSVPSTLDGKSSSLSAPVQNNFFASSGTFCKENGGPSQRSGLFSAAAGIGNDNGSGDILMSDGSDGHGVSIICDIADSRSVGNIVDDICCGGSRMFCDDSLISGHVASPGMDRGGRTSSSAVIDRTSTPADSGAAYSNPSFPGLHGGTTAASAGHRNRAGVSISCDNLSSLELEMTYDPHGCIYGPEGCLTPDSAWKKHLEFLAYIPESY